MTGQARGAYGLRLGPPVEDRFLVDVPATAPGWALRWRLGTFDDGQPQRLTEDEAVLDLQPQGRAHVQRGVQLSTLYLDRQPSAEAWPHPYLASTASVVARWYGRNCFHAGAFVHEGRAWAVIGGRNEGKSSALAWLALQGVPVMADDIAVVEGDRVLAGPRCLDLRRGAHERMRAGSYIGWIGTRERWRIPLGPAPYSAPFAGWVTLAWDAALSMTALPAAERLPQLLAHRALLLPETDHRGWLSLLARPMVQLRRPPDWDSLGTAMEALLAYLGQAA